jgi:hypothetical protein
MQISQSSGVKRRELIELTQLRLRTPKRTSADICRLSVIFSPPRRSRASTYECIIALGVNLLPLPFKTQSIDCFLYDATCDAAMVVKHAVDSDALHSPAIKNSATTRTKRLNGPAERSWIDSDDGRKHLTRDI